LYHTIFQRFETGIFRSRKTCKNAIYTFKNSFFEKEHKNTSFVLYAKNMKCYNLYQAATLDSSF